MLTAFYDLSTSPPTYDFLSFLLTAEAQRIAFKHDALEVRVLPGPKDGFKAAMTQPICSDTRRRMLANVVVPMTSLLPSCAGCAVQEDREKGQRSQIGYEKAMYGLPRLLEAARAGNYPLRAPPLRRDGYVTITLRESSYGARRNGDVAEWVAVARHLQQRGHEVVIVRDTEKAHEALEDLTTSPRAALDLVYRASLYSSAALNMFTNNGPAWLCMFLRAPCAIFKMVADAPMTTAKHFSKMDYPPGTPWPNAGEHQRVVWADDAAQNIIPIVEEMLCKLSGLLRSPVGEMPTLRAS